MRALEISSGKTSAELEKMLEQGQLTSEYIKPMVMAMGELASKNGAYTKALQKLGTVENRMKASGGLAAARIGEYGFTEGLIGLYEKLIDTFNNNEHSLKELGKVFNVFFKILKKGLDIVTPMIAALVRTLGTLARGIEYLAANPVKAMELGFLGAAAAIALLIKKIPDIKTLGSVLAGAFRSPLVILMSIIAIMDEIRAYFDADVIGLFDDPKMSKKDRDKEAAERSEFWRGVKSDGTRVANPLRDDVFEFYGGSDSYLAAPISELVAVLANIGRDIRLAVTESAGKLGGGMNSYMENLYSNSTYQIPNITIINPIMLDGREISRTITKDVNKQQQAQMATSLPAGGQ